MTIERGGAPVAVGMVLAGDGRVLTALSALGATDQADIRYADGTTAHVRVGFREASWDLALLVPQSGHWTDGLMASEVDPATAEQTAAFIATRAAPAPIPAQYKDKIEARSKTGDLLVDALEFDTHRAPTLGTPIVDATGRAVALLVHGCKDQTGGGAVVGPCSDLVFGAPVPVLRRFLIASASAPPPAPPVPAVVTAPAAPTPWLGIRGEADTTGAVHGVRVLAVAGGSPADKAGLKTPADHAAGDLIVAVNAEPVATPETLSEYISKHKIGDTVKLLLFNGDRFREVNVVLLRAAQPH